ncbi:hypothetical protein Mesau_02741 [Mesorhizobium australicum WSM2073]|uniref:Uncharacterized protein n=1 Tax=Mesorhizobium australicum (strain HAMBI 3006 / LMG 24608 / WSM2073) TaxID=754035 RepID=L0KJF1_MESAW|nr:hypothetical protein Mesau_02741 [Mesorhizobium australicum WSM2073]
MAREFCRAITFGQVAADTSGQSGALDQSRHFLVVEPLGADRLALAGDAPEEGPWAIRASFSQVCRATTGQVAPDEPRPISTSRQPVFPRKVTKIPLSGKNSIQPEESSV